MTSSLNPSTDITAYINPIFEASLLVAREQNVMVNNAMIRIFNDRTGMAVRKNSQYGGMTVNSIIETDDLQGQEFKPGVIASLTPSEAGGQYFLTDTRVESDPFAVQEDAARDMGQAMSSKMDVDMISLFSTFTGGTVGAAGTVITWGHLLAAEAQLVAKFAPYPYFCVLHPYQWQVLAKAASVASTVATNAAPSLLEEVNKMFFVKQVGGIMIFTSANVSIDGSNDAHGGMWSRDALAMDIRRAPRIAPQRDESRRGTELNLSTVYAKGLWRPTFGVDMFFDAAVPTN
jgi:hypothetical protein